MRWRRRGSPASQENNIVQTVASAAGTLSSIIFVLPGLVIVSESSGCAVRSSPWYDVTLPHPFAVFSPPAELHIGNGSVRTTG